MNILILTKNNPIEANNITDRIRNLFFDMNKSVLCISPQKTATEIQGITNFTYLDLFYPVLKVYENTFDSYVDLVDVFITVGTAPKSLISKYNAIVGLNSELSDYPEEQFSTAFNEVPYLTLADADIVFDNYGELRTFLYKVVINGLQ